MQRILVLALVVLPLLAGHVPATTGRAHPARLAPPAVAPGPAARRAEPAPAISIRGPRGEATPVVNERGKLRLKVVGPDGKRVRVTRWSSGSPAIATVSKSGVLKGFDYGFATITAETAAGEASVTAVVARVSVQNGGQAEGDTKTDTSGNVYLSSPREHVVYRTTGSIDEVFAGTIGDKGYVDGEGTEARFDFPTGLGIDLRAGGGIYVADAGNNCVRKIGFGGGVRTALGSRAAGTMLADSTPFEQAAMFMPRGVATVRSNLMLSDTGNHALYYANFDSRNVDLIAGSPTSPGFVDGPLRTARFNMPSGLATNAEGDLVAVADTGNNAVRLVRLLRAGDGRLRGDVSTLGQSSSARAARPSTPGPPVTPVAFDRPESVSFDGVGNVYVVDAAGASVVPRTLGQTLDKIDLAQVGSLGQPASLVVSGTRVLVLDAAARAAEQKLKVVEVGPPKIKTLDRDHDTLLGGAEVVVEGLNFPPETSVVLGDREVSDVIVESATRLRFRVPRQDATGARTLTVRTRGGTIQRVFYVTPVPLDGLAPGEITTVAGGGLTYLGDGGSANDDQVRLLPGDVVVDGAGNMFVSQPEARRIRRVDASLGLITTVAGTGVGGFSGDGGPATAARLNLFTGGLAVDAAGNLFVVDGLNYRVRRVDAITGIITTVAGNGDPSFSGDGGLAVDAGMAPRNVAIDRAGSLYIAEGLRIRRVDAVTGRIETIAGNGSLTPADDGALATSGLIDGDLEVSTDGGLYVAGGTRVRRVDLVTGIVRTVAGTGEAGSDGDGGPATSARLDDVRSIAVDAQGQLFIAEGRSRSIRQVDPFGTISTLLDRDDNIVGLALAGPKRLYCAVGGGLRGSYQPPSGVLSIDLGSGEAQFVAGGGPAFLNPDNLPASCAKIECTEIASDAGGNLFIATGGGGYIYRVDAASGLISTIAGIGVLTYSGDGGPATSAGMTPDGLAVDRVGRVFFASSYHKRVRCIDAASGIVRTVAGTGTGFRGYSGDGGPATSAQLNSPSDVVLDQAGGLLICDSGNHRVRRLDLDTGVITTIAGNGKQGYSGDGGPAIAACLFFPYAIALDRAGNLFIADTDNNRIRRVDRASGIITTVAGTGASEHFGEGGPATAAGIPSPRAIAVDAVGNLFIGEVNYVRKIDAATGVITNVAGIGVDGFEGDGIPALDASIDVPSSLFVSDEGDLYMADSGGMRGPRVRVVRAIAAASP